jgi:hypothetical protein
MGLVCSYYIVSRMTCLKFANLTIYQSKHSVNHLVEHHTKIVPENTVIRSQSVHDCLRKCYLVMVIIELRICAVG